MRTVGGECENNNFKYTAVLHFVSFSSLDPISSMPADKESFIFSIKDEMSLEEKVIASISDLVLVGGIHEAGLCPCVRTVENVVLKTLDSLCRRLVHPMHERE